ncbi:YoaK family protein [Allorhodopirellula heiligendammensis]|uniref:DUF1275 domain-containing protein n=1 Tax=Allorhodopirellula heiligendammensis TaxID=2714739 RepID=A0A5C6BU19_9BACT|nr:YoaK family protein [Allorhodopirellula heiligendammensis]TWU15505.1 hypothetical protein Poly21_27020 [Allorhodopirellula heiligendammensis]
MITKLPRWVEIGGFWLSCIAGATNAIGLLGFRFQAVSHVTGTSTLLGVSLGRFNVVDTARLLGIILSFVLGAVIAGALLGNASLKLGRRYGVALVMESFLLIGAMFALLSTDSVLGHCLAATACGLQNGMVSTYSGAVVRTTHVTGLLTDLGTMLGTWFRGHSFNVRQAVLYLLLITGFVVGGSIGALLFDRFHVLAMLFPASGALILAFIYGCLATLKTQN